MENFGILDELGGGAAAWRAETQEYAFDTRGRIPNMAHSNKYYQNIKFLEFFFLYEHSL